MTKITLSTVSELQAFPSAAANINSNSAIITAAMDNTLSRDGTNPNTMNANLDMNSHRILNLPLPVSNLEPARLVDLETLTGAGTITINPLPTGGTIGQVLEKNSGTNYDASWLTIQQVPAGGTTNQTLTKNTGTDYDISWKTRNLVDTIAGNTGAFTLGSGLTNTVNVLKVNAGHVPGETTTGSATAGEVGEYMVNTGNAIALTSTVPLNVTSITLTAGDWDIAANTLFVGLSSTSVTNTATSLNTASATINSTIGFYANSRIPASVDYQCAHSVGPTRVSISGSTTYFLVAQATFTVNTYSVTGIIRARRIR